MPLPRLQAPPEGVLIRKKCMFRVRNTILSEEIATAKFACDVSRCKGACCVVGEAGAPVSKGEIPVLKKAWRLLKDELRPEAVEAVERDGLITGDEFGGWQISCVNDQECVFVQFDEHGVAQCAIQKAWRAGRFNWEKPLSCHLYPIRLAKMGELEYANFEYIPELCSAGCENSKRKGVWLSDFLGKSLVRRYGEEWYEEFLERCEEVRKELL